MKPNSIQSSDGVCVYCFFIAITAINTDTYKNEKQKQTNNGYSKAQTRKYARTHTHHYLLIHTIFISMA